jgi:hypothetical protein
MNATAPLTKPTQPSLQSGWLALCVFLAIAAFFLWEEHRAHLLGAIPYLLVLLCPAVHLFMHRGHGHGSAHAAGQPKHQSHEAGGRHDA